MKYIKGEDRRQYVLFPACLDEYIEQDNPVRYIDAFVDSQDLEELGFNHTKREAPGNGGRPSYDPSDILKLLIYGYFNSTSNPQAISMAISIAVKSLNTMHHDSMSVNFVRFLHTFPFPHNAT